VPCAETELRQFAESVELFSDELPRTDDADRIVAVTLLHVAEPPRHGVDGVRPADAGELRAPRRAEQRVARARVGMNGLVFRQARRTQCAGVYRMVRIAANADGPAIPDSDEHAAAHGAIAAGRRDPAIRNPLRRRVP